MITMAVVSLIIKYTGKKGLFAISSVFTILLAVLGFIYCNQSHLLYKPLIPESSLSPSGNPPGYKHPTERDLNSQDVVIRTLDNIVLRGWLVKRQNSSRLVIYFHENAGNIGYRMTLMENILHQTHSDVLLVAYRGYSDSQGTPTEEGLQRDAQAILDWAINYKNKAMIENKPKKIYVLGRSLGGAVAIYISSKQVYKNEISGLILENTFTSISDMAGLIFPILSHLSFLLTNLWRSIDLIHRIEQPILFIRSMKDEIVPTEQMGRLINDASKCEFKIEYQIQEGTHNGAWEQEPDTYFSHYINFFQRVENSDSK